MKAEVGTGSAADAADAQPKAKARATVKKGAGAKPAAGAAATGDGSAPKKGARGRPPRDPCLRVDEIVQQFLQADINSPVFFDTKDKTKLKALKDLRTLVVDRLSAKDIESQTVQAFSKRRKVLDFIVAMIEVSHGAGFSSPHIVELYDMHKTAADLDPKIDLPVPGFLRWRRHAFDIYSTRHVQVWLRKISSTQLKTMSAPEPDLEQVKFMSQRVLGIVKRPKLDDVFAGLKELFSTENVEFYDFADELLTVAAALVVVSNYLDYEDLAERRELLRDALADVQTHFRHAVMTSMKATPKGREVMDRATAHVPALENAIEYHAGLMKCIDKFDQAVDGFPVSGSELWGIQLEYLSSAFSSLVLTLKDTEHNHLFPEATIKADQNKVKQHVDAMFAKVFAGCLNMLKPLLVDKVDSIIDSCF